MKCCGQERTTRFCPECGKQVSDSSGLYGLLAHCRKSAQHAQKESESWDAHDPERPAAKRSKVNAAKWKTWVDVLEKTIKGDGAPDQ